MKIEDKLSMFIGEDYFGPKYKKAEDKYMKDVEKLEAKMDKAKDEKAKAKIKEKIGARLDKWVEWQNNFHNANLMV